jgi:hypothetical protein
MSRLPNVPDPPACAELRRPPQGSVLRRIPVTDLPFEGDVVEVAASEDDPVQVLTSEGISAVNFREFQLRTSNGVWGRLFPIRLDAASCTVTDQLPVQSRQNRAAFLANYLHQSGKPLLQSVGDWIEEYPDNDFVDEVVVAFDRILIQAVGRYFAGGMHLRPCLPQLAANLSDLLAGETGSPAIAALREEIASGLLRKVCGDWARRIHAL